MDKTENTTARQPPYAHIYAQPCWHDAAHIVGNRAALVALRTAIDRALESGAGAAELIAGDGEGYSAICVLSESVMDTASPYTDELAADANDSSRRRPWDINPLAQAKAVADAQADFASCE